MHPHVLAALEQTPVRYVVHRHADLPAAIRGPRDFAQALGYELARITKSLFVRCQDQHTYAIVVCSVNRKVDLPAIAARLDCKRVELAGHEELRDHTGYPPAGVSPIGAGAIAVFMDQALFRFPTVLIGAGEVGVEIEIAPDQLQAIARAVVLPLTLE